jgi:protein-tyrosine-phosphatase
VDSIRKTNEVTHLKDYDRIIFVDSDDTARSVMAAALMKKQDLLSEPQIFSRGLVVLFPAPVNQKVVAIMASHDLDVTDHQAAQLSPEDVTARTLILVMEESQRNKVSELLSGSAELYTISEFTGFSGDIEPLFGAELSEYGKCYELLNELVRIAAARINEEEEN